MQSQKWRDYIGRKGAGMDVIANKIRTLRKNKNMTQEELAEVLLVSPQAVSKWETGQSVPDVELLPVIARYFGITMDEFFNYRLDALSYKERFIRFMTDNGVLKFGQFELNSGRISPYYIDTGCYKSAAQIAKLGEFYADCIRDNNLRTQLLYGENDKTTPLVISVSMVLYNKYGKDINYCIHNELGTFLKSGMEVLIIEDTLTSGDSLKRTIEELNQMDVKVSGIVVSVDRMEKGIKYFENAGKNIAKEYGVKVFSIVTLEDIINAMKNGVIGAGYLEAMIAYRNKYGG